MHRRSFLKLAMLIVSVPAIPKSLRNITAERVLEAPHDALVGIMHKADSHFIIQTDRGWVKCDGRTLSRSDYPELFQVLRGVYGETHTGFRVPDMRRKHAA